MMYLALARDFLLKGEWPSHDPYLYSLPNAQLHMEHEYLSYLIFYGAWWLCGYPGLLFVKMIVLATLFIVALRAHPRAQNSSPLFMTLWILAVLAASFRFIERSSLFSDLFCVVLTGWLAHQQKITRKFILLVTALFLVWAQLHPAFLLGVALLGIWGLWNFIGNPDFRNRKVLLLLLPVAVLCVNPLGIEGALYPLRFGLNEATVLKRHNMEWFPTFHPAFRFTPEVLAFWTLCLASLFILLREKAWLSLRAVLTLFAMVTATYAVRFVPWASFAMLVLLKPWAHYTWSRSPVRVLTYGLSLLLLLVGIKNFIWGYESSSGQRIPAARLDSKFFPVKTLEVLRANPLNGRVYNAHDFGAYMIWMGFYPVFHHGFVTDMEFYENEVTGLFRSPDKFFELVQKYHWTMLLVDKYGSYSYFYKVLGPLPDWKIVAEDDASYLIYYLPEARQ